MRLLVVSLNSFKIISDYNALLRSCWLHQLSIWFLFLQIYISFYENFIIFPLHIFFLIVFPNHPGYFIFSCCPSIERHFCRQCLIVSLYMPHLDMLVADYFLTWNVRRSNIEPCYCLPRHIYCMFCCFICFFIFFKFCVYRDFTYNLFILVLEYARMWYIGFNIWWFSLLFLMNCSENNLYISAIFCFLFCGSPSMIFLLLLF